MDYSERWRFLSANKICRIYSDQHNRNNNNKLFDLISVEQYIFQSVVNQCSIIAFTENYRSRNMYSSDRNNSVVVASEDEWLQAYGQKTGSHANPQKCRDEELSVSAEENPHAHRYWSFPEPRARLCKRWRVDCVSESLGPVRYELFYRDNQVVPIRLYW